MKDSGDIAGTGVPFAAGVAAGAFLAASLKHIPLQLPFLLAVLLPLATAITYQQADSRHPRKGGFAVLFLLAGLFCSVNAAVSAGIPLPKGPLGRIAEVEGERLKRLIDSIP